MGWGQHTVRKPRDYGDCAALCAEKEQQAPPREEAAALGRVFPL